MNLKLYLFTLIIATLTSCSIPVDVAPPPTALPLDTPKSTLIVPATFTPVPTLTQLPASTFAPSFCDDSRGLEVIKSFTKAIASKDGHLLSSLVSPSKGMDVRYYRDGNVVNYDVEHAKFVFETTFHANWGLSYGSGEPTLGSFQDIILPSLQKVFTSNAVIVCNQIKVGGATYQPIWPYQKMDYYSVHFPGTDEFGGLNWQTWLIGMDKAAGKLFVAALVHFVWEP
jgi:hypothetical protein